MFFDFLGISILLSALLVITTYNQVHALFHLISVFIQITVLLLVYYDVEFVPFLLIIVYIGAIAILFLFVVMMLDVNVPSNATNTSLFGIVLFLYLSIVFLFDFFSDNFFLTDPYARHYSELLITSPSKSPYSFKHYFWTEVLMSGSDLKTIASVLYNKHSYSFILSSFVLLVAMLGAISLTLKQKAYVKRQLVVDQNHRDFEKTIRRLV